MKRLDPAKTIITHDAGTPREQIISFWEATVPRGYIGWGKTTQLGFGLGAIMGAKLAEPDKVCVNIMGDSAIGMVGMDIETAVRNKIGIITVIFNNGIMAIETPSLKHAHDNVRRELPGRPLREARRCVGRVVEADRKTRRFPAGARSGDCGDEGRPARGARMHRQSRLHLARPRRTEGVSSMAKRASYKLYGAKGGGVDDRRGGVCANAMLPVEFVDLAWDDIGWNSRTLAPLNPLGQVPTLVMPDGTVMTESAAIMLHLAEVAPAAKLVPPPDHPQHTAFLRWLVFLVSAVYSTFTYGDVPKRWVAGDEDAAKALRASTDEHREHAVALRRKTDRRPVVPRRHVVGARYLHVADDVLAAGARLVQGALSEAASNRHGDGRRSALQGRGKRNGF